MKEERFPRTRSPFAGGDRLLVIVWSWWPEINTTLLITYYTSILKDKGNREERCLDTFQGQPNRKCQDPDWNPGHLISKLMLWDFPGGAVVENLPANAGDTSSSPGLGRSHMPRSN